MNSLESQDGGGGSHCFEPDGSFHVVCMFVIGVSIFCGAISLICTLKVVKMIVQIVREPDNVRENVKMYKLQPVSQTKEDIELEFISSSDDVKSKSIVKQPTACNNSATTSCTSGVCTRVGKQCVAGHCACRSKQINNGSDINRIDTVESVYIKQEKDFEESAPSSPCIC